MAVIAITTAENSHFSLFWAGPGFAFIRFHHVLVMGNEIAEHIHVFSTKSRSLPPLNLE
jgi:hypothetical protein